MPKRFFFAFVFLNFLISLQALDLTGIADSFTENSNEGLTTFQSMNIPSGGRTEALGTAFTALADDISFFDYNPAASAVLDETEIAVFHNAWISDSAQETLAFTRRNGRLGYGSQLKCFYVPFSEYNLYGDRVHGSYYSETSLSVNFAYNFLSGYNFRGLALGMNAKAAWRGMPDYTDNRDDSIIKGSGLEQSALGLMADFGALMRFSFLKFYQDREPNLKVALALNNFGVALTGFGSKIQKDDDTPSRISFGFSYKPFTRFLFSAELRKPLLLSDFSSSGSLSFALGAEAQVTDFFAFQMGFLLQGANPRFSLGGEFEIRGIKLDAAYTLDLTSSANPVNRISLSAKMLFGDRGRKDALQKADESYVAGLKLYAAGYYNEAILKWNEAISIAAAKPLEIKYEPAYQAREAALNFNKSKSELEGMYSIDFDD